MEHFSENGLIHDVYTRPNQEGQTPVRLRVLEKGLIGKESRTLSSAVSSQIIFFVERNKHFLRN